MNKLYRKYKRLSIWILLCTQLLLIASYFYLKVDTSLTAPSKISFLDPHDVEEAKKTYHTGNDRIFLKTYPTRNNYIDFNSSLCYINGTDLVSMRRTKNPNWQCKCLVGWHGKDCGQPEIIWRAFLTQRKAIKITARTFQRRLIYVFPADRFSENIAEIRINELEDVVDLFIICESNRSDFFERKLNNKFALKVHSKIIYIKQDNDFWNTIGNVQSDDVILTSTSNEIPNKYAINFMKYYDNWPQPMRFRLKWTVFGFFWLHPTKTIIKGGAASVGFIKETINGQIKLLNDTNGLVLGDLNHYGGWFCEYCNDVALILDALTEAPPKSINLDQIEGKKIDAAFIEDCIENGLYIDGKTELLRTHRYTDTYFAPYHVTEQNWKYDSLLINFYSKLDY